MAAVVRYVNSAGFVMERFLGIIHVKETSANSLKEALQNLLSLHKLSLSSIRGQGKKSRRRTSSISNMHHYKNDCLFSVLDLQLQELNDRFDVENTELLYCVACLSPSSSFAAFDEDKLIRMIELYSTDFVEFPEVIVRNQLRNYIEDVRCDPNFSELKGLSDLCRKLVETNKCTTYNVMYKLVKLALILPVATASVERVFSATKYVKSELSSKMGDQWLNDRLVTFIERNVLKTISNDVILAHFQEMNGKCRLFSL
ncbi:hypothetical protein OROGR_022932 [Orobanche gracilis]